MKPFQKATLPFDLSDSLQTSIYVLRNNLYIVVKHESLDDTPAFFKC